MSTNRKAIVGAFVVGGVLLFAGGLFFIGDRRLLFAPQLELHTAFTKVSGLQVGTKVRVSGFDAGEVLEIQLPAQASEKFVVRMRLREDLRPLVRTDSVCAVQTDGIVGSAFIQIGRGSDGARMVEPGDMLAGADPVDFADLIEEGRTTFQTVSREVVSLSAEVARTIQPLTETVHTANALLEDVGGDVKAISRAGMNATEDTRLVIADARAIVSDLRAGRGTLGQLFTDDTPYKRWVGMTTEAEQAMANVRATTERARTLVDGIAARDGAAQQIVQTLRDTLTDTREVMSDLSEGTEALKRNFLFRGFFRDRGFFDLDAITREAYLAGALERGNRTAVRIWIDAAGLFAAAPDGREQLTEDGRRRLESAMADLVRYPRDSPLVVEGYSEPTAGASAYLVSSDRALLVRDYLLGRFRRRVTLTGIMPMADQAAGSPRGDRWSGVALTMFVRDEALTPQ
jgi:phospholipid/cholesterol/gamma-HCH transport system substrate-binding protein